MRGLVDREYRQALVVAIEREPGVADLYFTKRREGKQRPQTLYQFRLTGVGTRKPAAVDIDQSILSPALTGESQTPRLVHIDRGHVDRFLVAMEMPVKLMGGGELPFFFWPTESSAALPAMVASPVVWGNVVYGRSRDGMLVQQEIGDVGRGLLEAAERPAGAVDGPITCANGVLLLGNYALDIETRRILWTAPDLKFDGRLVPAVDGVVVFHDGEGSLVAAEGSGPSAGAGADATSLAAAIEPTLPGTGDAVVLVDGTRIPGRLETGEDGAAAGQGLLWPHRSPGGASRMAHPRRRRWPVPAPARRGPPRDAAPASSSRSAFGCC